MLVERLGRQAGGGDQLPDRRRLEALLGRDLQDRLEDPRALVAAHEAGRQPVAPARQRLRTAGGGGARPATDRGPAARRGVRGLVHRAPGGEVQAAPRSGRSCPARRWPSRTCSVPPASTVSAASEMTGAPSTVAALAQQVVQAGGQRAAAREPARADGDDVDERQAGGGGLGEDDVDDRGQHRGQRVAQLASRRRPRRAAWRRRPAMTASQASRTSSCLPANRS